MVNRTAIFGEPPIARKTNVRHLCHHPPISTYQDELKLAQVANGRQTEQALLQIDEKVVARTYIDHDGV